jgi:hypothetical protein
LWARTTSQRAAHGLDRCQRDRIHVSGRSEATVPGAARCLKELVNGWSGAGGPSGTT